MSVWEMIITIGSVVAGTMVTRFISFALFAKSGKPPAIVSYLGKVLPGAVMGLLVVYALKGTVILTYPYGLPELLAVLLLVGIHLYKRNFLISILSSTIFYMILVQAVFV
ncbi:branched-chain amino acid transporter permease [uncultured Veillonella sp.]|uniref:branched-chain amino acid transporter permease n=1 Tax=uncultured Veillonella sp. TaxID=159268 RepID=UPI00262F76C3|nr:AzlD domain-containing protein [uncultured Veillonella sp.]